MEISVYMCFFYSLLFPLHRTCTILLPQWMWERENGEAELALIRIAQFSWYFFFVSLIAGK